MTELTCLICGKPLIGRQKNICSEYRCKILSSRKGNDPEFRERRRNRTLEWIKMRGSQSEWHKKRMKQIREYGYKQYRRKLGLPEDAILTRVSSIELIMKTWLQERGIDFKEQYYINLETHNTRVDFFIEPNICLYCDGDYWHGTNFPERQEVDKIQTMELERMDYIVIRLTEIEIMNGDRPYEILGLPQSEFVQSSLDEFYMI